MSKSPSRQKAARKPQREGDPEVWRSFQLRGSIDLLVLLEEHQEFRMRDILAALPSISKQVLARRLLGFQSLEIVDRRVEEGPPLATWYSLTPRGSRLAQAAEILVEVGGPPQDLK